MATSSQTISLPKLYRANYTSLRNDQELEMPIWLNIRDFLGPRSAKFRGEDKRGIREDLNIINTSPRYSVRTLPSGLQSGITSPMRPWFHAGLPDQDLEKFGPVKEWLYTVETRMRGVFARSNIYDRLKSNYGTLGLYGTSSLFVDEDADEVIRAYDYSMGTFMLAQNVKGRCDQMYRDVNMSCRGWVEKFAPQIGFDRLPDKIKRAWDQGNYQVIFPICHIIEPNRDFLKGSALGKNKNYASIWFDPSQGGEGDGGIIWMSGYDDLPSMNPRWDVLGENTWGHGCGELALGDGKQMQHMEKRKLQAIDKNTNPTMLADASMRNQRVANLPGETVYVNNLINGKPGYQPAYQPNPYINEIREENAAVGARIDEAFYKNLFLMVQQFADQPNITATQINTLREEKLLMLGPVLERLNSELLSPLIDRTFNIMYRRGMLPPPPKEIQGSPLRIEYINILAQAQKAMGIGNIERFTGFIGGLAQAQSAAGMPPTAYSKLDIFEVIEAYGDGVSVPPNIIHSDDEAQATLDGQAQQAQAAMATQQAQQTADTAKTASEIDLQGDNAVTRALQVAGAA